MSPAVWTNTPFPGGCVPGGIICDGLRCWQRMENAMHNKYWSSGRMINTPWLGEEKGRWSTRRLVHFLMWPRSWAGYFYLRTHRRWPWKMRLQPGTNTDAAHAQVQTKAIKHTHSVTNTHTPQSDTCGIKNQNTNTRRRRSILHTMARWPFGNIPHRQKQKKWSAAARDEEGLRAQRC